MPVFGEHGACPGGPLTAGAVTVAGVGSRVLVEYASGGSEEFALAGPEDADATAGRVSTASPLGRAVLGRRAGDRVVYRAPAGVLGATLVYVR
ncbi:MAG: GreA/GreB family elongation factor [Chloroflexi bacterium]|nr:MAG: GreA/GreB family elongation factor [Chloroflexota bacterium]